MNHKMIRYIIGMMIQMEAAFLLLPLLTAMFYGERCMIAFFLTALGCLAGGRLLRGKRPGLPGGRAHPCGQPLSAGGRRQ